MSDDKKTYETLDRNRDERFIGKELVSSKTVSLRKLLLDVNTYLRNSVGVPHDYEGVPRVELLEGIAAHLTRIDSQVETPAECHHLPTQAAWCPKCQQSMPGGDALHTDHCPAVKTPAEPA